MQGLRRYQDNSESVGFKWNSSYRLMCLESQILGGIARYPQKLSLGTRWCIKINKWNIPHNHTIVILIYSLL